MNDNATVMPTNDAPYAKHAEVFVTIGDRRYSMLVCKNFEGKANVSSKEVPCLGSVVTGSKPGAVKLSFKMTIYKCTEIFDDVLEQYINTGRMPRFDIQTTNDDPATSMGASIKVYNNCTLDGDVLLSMTGVDDNFIEQEISGFAESITRPKKYTNPSYMG